MEKYKELLLSMGSDSVKIIDTKTIITAPWTIFKCQFGCSRYGRNWSCPPKTPNYKLTQEIIDSYQIGVLFRCHDMSITTEIAIKVGREMFLDGYYKSIVFGSGPCKLCEECNTQRCNYPEKAVPSMEACGIDVFQTVMNNGYEIKPFRGKEEVQNYFALVLVE